MNEMTITTNDGFDVAEHVGASMIVGKMLKFTDGQWICDKTEPMPANANLVAAGVITVWVRWQEGKPSEHRITQTGQLHPHRDELPDLDETKWPPGLNDEPADPWRDTRYLRLIDPNTGADYTFVTDSHGGRRAISDLKQQIANVRTAHPGAVPVVQLASTPMKTKFGQKARPDFKIVGWRGKRDDSRAGNGNNAQNNAQNDDMNDDIPF
jgi:hypothetical protein